MTRISISSSAVAPVNHSASQACGKVSPTPEATYRSNLSSWLTTQMPAGSSLKTWSAYSAPEASEEAILPDSYRLCADGKSSHRLTVGVDPASSNLPPAASAWHGGYLTLNTPEFPNFQGRSRSEGDVSSLSDILVVGNVPQKYYLTVKCAEGILRRAARRGKTLPPVLEVALRLTVGTRSASM